MKPGDPWDTEERDELRSQQRRELWELPAGLVALAGEVLNRMPAVSPHDRPLLERRLRDTARRQTRDLVSTLAVLRLEVEHLATKPFADAVYGVLRPDSEVVAQITPEVADEKRSAVDSLKHDMVVRVRQWAVLLILADEMADDRYRDPRLPEWT